jgi:hypothetical protein
MEAVDELERRVEGVEPQVQSARERRGRKADDGLIAAGPSRDEQRTRRCSRRRPRSWFLVTSRLSARPPLLSYFVRQTERRRASGWICDLRLPSPAMKENLR